MPKRTYKIGEDIYDIEDSDVEGFLKSAPEAKEVKSFVLDNDTFDIELPDVDAVLKGLVEQSLPNQNYHQHHKQLLPLHQRIRKAGLNFIAKQLQTYRIVFLS